MKIGLISDIYANLPALEAAWTYLLGQGVEMVICLGNLVQFGPFPEEVVCFVRDHGIQTVQGNCDRAAARGRSSTGDDFDIPYWEDLAEQSLIWTREQLDSENIEYLKNLPEELRYSIGRNSILCTHGLPGRVEGKIKADTAHEIHDMHLSRNGCNVLLTGNTGIPALIIRPGGCLINPGSVGGGTLPSQATVAVLEVEEDRSIPVWWQRLFYDFERYAYVYRKAGLSDIFLRCIRTGRDPRGEWHTSDIVWRQQWAEQ